MQDHIPDALIAAFERQYDASWNDPQLRNERLAMRYGWAAAIEQKQKQCLFQIQEPAPVPAAPPASQRDELLQVALDFIGTLTGMSPPPIEVAPPEVFAPFLAFVDRVQAITARQAQADALDAAPAASEQDAPITWPKARDVGRIGDMSPSAHMRVGFDSDNDVLVSVYDESGGGSIEFCNPGGGGGGQSSRTRMALIALMVAMEADNAEKPSRDWWAQRSQAAQQGGAA